MLKREIRIGALVSGDGTNLQAIQDKIESHELRDCKIVCVGSNNHEAFGLERARRMRIPTFTLQHNALTNLSKTSPARLNLGVPYNLNEKECLEEMGLANTHENRVRIRILATAEVELLNILKEYKVDLLICAGFDRLLSAHFQNEFQPDKFNPHIMNIHPAITPAYPGMNAYKKAWNRGAKAHGITVHFMNKGVDTGPVIAHKAYEVLPRWTFDDFKNKGLELEYDTYWRCIQLYIEGSLKVKPGPDGKHLVVETLNPKKFNPR